MSRLKIFVSSYVLAFASTAVLCILSGQPLIFLPVSYGMTDFLAFGILILILTCCLNFICLPFLEFIRKIFRIGIREDLYFVTGTLIILQIVTLLVGYLESGITRHIIATPFYYYQGVGNSLVYVITGNMTAIMAASLYGKQKRLLAEAEARKFEFEK
jgi:hypothetical protein